MIKILKKKENSKLNKSEDGYHSSPIKFKDKNDDIIIN